MSAFVPDPVAVSDRSWLDLTGAKITIVCGKDLIVRRNGDHADFPASSDLASFYDGPALRTGTIDGAPCFAVEIGERLLPETLPPGTERMAFRIAMGYLEPGIRPAVCRGRELLHWRKQHEFCGRCGQRLADSKTDIARVCPSCGEHYYPQIAPAVIVGILRGDKILLAHNKRFQPDMYGLIAGFVEAGECVEEAIIREIREETGIEVGNVRYFSSQSWPFPNSLMLAYYADYVSGEAKPDGTELESLGWFSADAMPVIPQPGSIARKLIDDFIERHSK